MNMFMDTSAYFAKCSKHMHILSAGLSGDTFCTDFPAQYFIKMQEWYSSCIHTMGLSGTLCMEETWSQDSTGMLSQAEMLMSSITLPLSVALRVPSCVWTT
jgi:hypothetical protein